MQPLPSDFANELSYIARILSFIISSIYLSVGLHCIACSAELKVFAFRNEQSVTVPNTAGCMDFCGMIIVKNEFYFVVLVSGMVIKMYKSKN
jgi:hypothetical protein